MVSLSWYTFSLSECKMKQKPILYYISRLLINNKITKSVSSGVKRKLKIINN